MLTCQRHECKLPCMGPFYCCGSKVRNYNMYVRYAEMYSCLSNRGTVIATCEEKETIVYADIGWYFCNTVHSNGLTEK